MTKVPSSRPKRNDASSDDSGADAELEIYLGSVEAEIARLRERLAAGTISDEQKRWARRVLHAALGLVESASPATIAAYLYQHASGSYKASKTLIPTKKNRSELEKRRLVGSLPSPEMLHSLASAIDERLSRINFVGILVDRAEKVEDDVPVRKNLLKALDALKRSGFVVTEKRLREALKGRR